LVDPASWTELHEHYAQAPSIGFETNGNIEIPLGLREIVEGQARISEVQFRTFTQRAMSWKEVGRASWLQADYGRAFRLFLEWTGLHAPTSPRSSHVISSYCSVTLRSILRTGSHVQALKNPSLGTRAHIAQLQRKPAAGSRSARSAESNQKIPRA